MHRHSRHHLLSNWKDSERPTTVTSTDLRPDRPTLHTPLALQLSHCEIGSIGDSKSAVYLISFGVKVWIGIRDGRADQVTSALFQHKRVRLNSSSRPDQSFSDWAVREYGVEAQRSVEPSHHSEVSDPTSNKLHQQLFTLFKNQR